MKEAAEAGGIENFQKDSEETAPESNPLLEKGLTKAERKQMKRDRRSDRVAQREVELQ